MTATQTQPRFVNLQASPVRVFDENRRAVSVLPFANRNRDPQGVYVLEGGHYQQFVSGNGPLYPFPADQNAPPGPLAPSADTLQARAVAAALQSRSLQERAARDGGQASSGRLRITADVVRNDTVIGETHEAFVLRIRQALMLRGIVTVADFNHEPRQTLLQIAGVTEENVASIREMADELFPPMTVAPSTEGLPVDEDGNLLNTYKREAVNKLDLKGLRDLIDDEGFELSKAGRTDEVRKRVIDALLEWKMLVE